MLIESAFQLRFDLFDGNAMRVSPCVLADARDLPRDFNVRFVGLDRELVVGHFAGHNGLSELPYDRELIAKIAVQGFEPFWKGDDSVPLGVGDYVAVVDVHHVGRLHKRVIEVLVRRIERMVDLERTAILGKIPIDIHVSVEPGSVTGDTARQDSRAVPGVVSIHCPTVVAGLSVYSGAAAVTHADHTGRGEAVHSDAARFRVGSVNTVGIGVQGLTHYTMVGLAQTVDGIVASADSAYAREATALSEKSITGRTLPDDSIAVICRLPVDSYTSGARRCYCRAGRDGRGRGDRASAEAARGIALDDGVGGVGAGRSGVPFQSQRTAGGNRRAADAEV